MKVLLSICFFLCLALSVNAVRVRTHARSQSTTGWQQYIDQQLIGSEQSSGAVIMELDGGVRSASNLNLKASGGAQIASLFKNPSSATSSGIVVNGVKCQAIKAGTQSPYGKNGATGVVAVKTNQLIIVSTYNERTQPGNAANVVEKLGDYFRDQGY